MSNVRSFTFSYGRDIHNYVISNATNNTLRRIIEIFFFHCPRFRYWLLTVLRAGEAIPPKIELKLARLYKTAFSRQQHRHLGLSQTNARFRRIARGHALLRNKVRLLNHRTMETRTNTYVPPLCITY